MIETLTIINLVLLIIISIFLIYSAQKIINTLIKLCNFMDAINIWTKNIK